MRNLWRAVAVLALVALVFTIAGCGGGAKKEEKKVLTIGTEATFAPFEFTNDKNEIVGFDIDVANYIAKELGMELKIVNMKFDGLIGALAAKQVDLVIAGMTITEERKMSVNFSDPYYDASQVIVVRADDTSVNKRDDLKGKIIAVQLGTTGADAAAEVEGAQVKPFPKVNEAFMSLKNSQADAVVIDLPVAKAYLKQIEGLKIVGEPFTEEQYGIAAHKENTELLAKVNEALKKMRDSGEYQKVYDKWIKPTE